MFSFFGMQQLVGVSWKMLIRLLGDFLKYLKVVFIEIFIRAFFKAHLCRAF
jgi:hypothetical protein